METVAESMANDFVGLHAKVPSSRKTAQAINTTRCLETVLIAFTGARLALDRRTVKAKVNEFLAKQSHAER